MTYQVQQFQSPWVGNENSIWLGTTLQLSRNVEKFNFPDRLDAERKAHIIQLIYQTLIDAKICPGLKLIPATEITPLDREYLLEHFLIFEPVPQPHPGEAFLVDSSGQVLFVINIKDHLHLIALNTSQDPEASWKWLTKVEDALQKNISFAFSDAFGYLTSDPFRAGTGLAVSAFLHVSGLIFLETLGAVLEHERQEAVLITGLYSNPDEFLGDVVVVKNKYALGVTEEIVISTVHKSALRIMAQEKLARSELKLKRPDEALDKVSRALASLQHSFAIGTREALKDLSLVKLGIELGWITGANLSDINKLFFDCRRAHLSRRLGTKFSIEHAHKARAEFLREETHLLQFV